MNGDSQRKGYSRWNWGPPTEPQMKQLYHGLGGEPIYTYTSNPVSWLVTLSECIPFLHLKAGEQDQPVDQEVANDILTSIQGGSAGPLEDTGSGFTSDPGGMAMQTPQAFNPGPEFHSLSSTGVPMGTIHGKMVPLWGSRKTYKGG